MKKTTKKNKSVSSTVAATESKRFVSPEMMAALNEVYFVAFGEAITAPKRIAKAVDHLRENGVSAKDIKNRVSFWVADTKKYCNPNTYRIGRSGRNAETYFMHIAQK